MVDYKRTTLFGGIMVMLVSLTGLTACGSGGGSSSPGLDASASNTDNSTPDDTTPDDTTPDDASPEEPEPSSAWSLVWSDEFDGDSLSESNWTAETGDGSQYGITAWGNNEKEWYKPDNISVADGNLVITALEETTEGYPYTSGRMRSDEKVDVLYGRIEARIQVPAGQGLWSAFWMLPTQSQYGGWASGGEIDIMEAVNPGTADGNAVHGTAHYGMAWPLNQGSGQSLDIDPSDGFHDYAVEWEQGEIRWYVDGIHFHTLTSDAWWSYYYGGQDTGYVSAPTAPFDQEFHLLLNLAVGGNWPGNPDGNTVFPAQMWVDYVRVYECSTDSVTGLGCASNVDPDVIVPASDAVSIASFDLYTDAAQALTWNIDGEIVSRGLTLAGLWDNGGALTLSEPDVGGVHGTVIDVSTIDSGNIGIYAEDNTPIILLGMGSSSEWWRLHAGELKFDLYIDSANTDPDSKLLIKMDSGWPALGYVELMVAELPQDEWTSVSVPVNDLLVNSGDEALDTASVVNLFVVEPTSFAHIQLDNVQLVCGHKDDNACGISSPAIEVTSETVDVFTDEISAFWSNGIGAWDDAVNSDYFDGASGNHVNWSLVDTGETGHDTVIEATFNADGNNGVLYIQSPTGVDLSSFSSGQLVFDVRVLDYGSNTSGMVFKVDCGFPCSSGDQALGVVGDAAWQTITVDVSSLVAAGLDLSRVNTGLVIFPTWGDQQGVTFQLDNVRWEVGGD